MFSVASLLNPAMSDFPDANVNSRSSMSLCSSPLPQSDRRAGFTAPTKKPKMSKDGAIFTKAKVTGEVNYPPFEHLSEEATREARRFHVHPVGKIQNYPRHIPYNSEKKTFLERTGRESFEVFQYVFKVPGDEKTYTVMWDYNIGLVRITPFFKCCKYSKTTPAKMLNMNPGLKDITHSITGGALVAQGYWMPYSCALAVCATFCYHIAPALVPVFGPSFPSLCVHPSSAEHGRMIIDPGRIRSATLDAERYRAQYSASSIITGPAQPHQILSPEHFRSTPPTLSTSSLIERSRMKRTFTGGENSFTDTDTSEASSVEYFHSPPTPINANNNSFARPHDWGLHSMSDYTTNSMVTQTPVLPNIIPHGPFRAYDSAFKAPNPLLSAIPRSTQLVDGGSILREDTMLQETAYASSQFSHSPIHTQWQAKHNFEHLEPRSRAQSDEDAIYDGGESSASVADERMSISALSDWGIDFTLSHGHHVQNVAPTTNNAVGAQARKDSLELSERNAALMLMNLSFRDSEAANRDVGLSIPTTAIQPPLNTISHPARPMALPVDYDCPRVKRRRATSI